MWLPREYYIPAQQRDWNTKREWHILNFNERSNVVPLLPIRRHLHRMTVHLPASLPIHCASQVECLNLCCQNQPLHGGSHQFTDFVETTCIHACGQTCIFIISNEEENKHSNFTRTRIDRFCLRSFCKSFTCDSSICTANAYFVSKYGCIYCVLCPGYVICRCWFTFPAVGTCAIATDEGCVCVCCWVETNGKAMQKWLLPIANCVN